MPDRRRFILVVDDDPEICEAFTEVLAENGYDARSANDGIEALDLLMTSREPPALILLDLKMPRKSGWDVLDVLRRSTILVDVPVVVVSANIGYPPAGAVAWLKKPIRGPELIGAVKKHMKAA